MGSVGLGALEQPLGWCNKELYGESRVRVENFRALGFRGER